MNTINLLEALNAGLEAIADASKTALESIATELGRTRTLALALMNAAKTAESVMMDDDDRELMRQLANNPVVCTVLATMVLNAAKAGK